MSIRDTKFTSPETLRNMYRNPKNAIKDAVNDTINASSVLRSPNAQAAGGVNTGGGGIPGNIAAKRLATARQIVRKPDIIPEQGVIEGERIL